MKADSLGIAQYQQDNTQGQSRLAWLAIALCACFLFYKYVLQVSPSVMTNDLMESFHIHGAGLGNLAATFFYSYLIIQIFSGPLLDRFGARYIGSLALLISALGTWLFAQADQLLWAEIGRALMGVGVAFATVTYLKVAATWFDARRFALLSGLVPTAVMIGAVFGQVPLAHVVASEGWRRSLELCAILGVIFSVLFLLFVRDKKSHSSAIDDTQQVSWQDIISVLKRRANWLLTLYSGLAFAPLAVFAGLWGNPFLVASYQLTTADAASLTSLVFIGLGVGGPIFGALADYFGKRTLWMFLGGFVTLASVLCLLYCPGLHSTLLSILMFLFGFGTSAFMLGFAMAKDMNSLLLAGTVVAMINTGDAILGAVTEPLVGYVLDLGWHGQELNHSPVFSMQDYMYAFSLLPVYLILSLLFLFWITKVMKKENKKENLGIST
ncbi:putative sulfoacetate transporter SauU [Piscirickettsia salmonis]|uniref:MFS transporter n=1 Tax=Piscirickettsia salmonis TaxID=1238 RepID=UPI0012B8F905|nr:MFS transporter [Piscirickettsia salmonis]QGP51903.1 putative sulfoacetate transporter SauU [Piscirickettsia salmonis]QGP52862.1 putative sulfoacetate transporter SauU [Piscirickettsia salmonis]QGP61213.1 putative sulfoacetate transporter SauU [Piscirickettsia salmonis]QGP62434.1 putative sulfoacetate transporter SauU [Piscirickettsia salmonis]